MEFRTYTAKTVDDAITNAQSELGVTFSELEYEVIEKGSAGFLGIGMKQAVIKARRKVDEVEEAAEEIEASKDAAAEEKPYRQERRDDRRNSGKNNRDRKKDKKHTKKDFNKNDKPVKEKAPAPVKEEVALAPVEDITVTTCVTFVEDVLKAMDMADAKVSGKVDEEGALYIEIEGENMGILIGKRGQTLDSLQYLTNRVANKMQDGYVRVKLDTEDYRRRRKQTLEHLAKNIASKVRRTRRAVSLEPMNPYERRIIHSALQNDPSVSTHSEGEEPYRRVVVTYVRR